SQRQLAEEVAQAARYVQSLLPEKLTGDVRVDWRFVPSAQLGGDMFGYHWIDPDHLAIYLLDVSGHGVGSSLLAGSAAQLPSPLSVTNPLLSRSGWRRPPPQRHLPDGATEREVLHDLLRRLRPQAASPGLLQRGPPAGPALQQPDARGPPPARLDRPPRRHV